MEVNSIMEAIGFALIILCGVGGFVILAHWMADDFKFKRGKN